MIKFFISILFILTHFAFTDAAQKGGENGYQASVCFTNQSFFMEGNLMGYYHFAELIASNAGSLDDGEILGSINRTLLTAVISNSLTAPSVYAQRKDKSSGATSYTDISSSLVSESTPLELFGTSGNMSSGDSVLIACDHQIQHVWFNVERAGVGTWGVLEVYESSNGKTFDRKLTITDDTNAFKATGWHRVHFTASASLMSPAPEDVTERRWLLFTLKDFVSVSTSPRTQGCYIIHQTSAITWNNRTDDKNGSIESNTFSNASTNIFHDVGGEQIYVFDNKALGLDYFVYRKYSQDMTRVKEYLATDGTWKALQNVVDGSNDWENGPTTLGTTHNDYTLRYTMPSDWTVKTNSYNMTDNTTLSLTGFFLRFRITNVVAPAPTAPALFRARARQYGNANTTGIQVTVATTLRSITFGEPLSISGTGDITLSLANLTTGSSASIVIPSTASWPYNVDFTDIALSANDKYGLFYISGSRSLTSVPITLHI